MNARVDHLLNEALGLPADERSALIVALIDSLEGADDSAHAQAWRLEVSRRQDEWHAGRIRAEPWSDARSRLNSL